MKPRILVTQKILAVALTAAAGCSTATGNDVTPRPVTDKDTLAAPAQTEVAPPAAESPQPTAVLQTPPNRPTSNDPALLALRDKLMGKPRAEVLADPEPFRPLCDKDGYPLVGNLMRKVATPDYQPSTFCADLRARAGAQAQR
jgi:hypothetical protein